MLFSNLIFSDLTFFNFRFAKHTKKPKEMIKNESIVILDDEKTSQSQPLKKPDKPVPGTV